MERSKRKREPSAKGKLALEQDPNYFPAEIDDDSDGERKPKRQRTGGAIRTCSVEGCPRRPKNGGKCHGHGGAYPCAVPGCTRFRQMGGFCCGHGGGLRCKKKGCKRFVAGSGKCRRHGGGVRCPIKGCKAIAYKGGKCREHQPPGLCTFPDCKCIATHKGDRCPKHPAESVCWAKWCRRPATMPNGTCRKHFHNPVAPRYRTASAAVRKLRTEEETKGTDTSDVDDDPTDSTDVNCALLDSPPETQIPNMELTIDQESGMQEFPSEDRVCRHEPFPASQWDLPLPELPPSSNLILNEDWE